MSKNKVKQDEAMSKNKVKQGQFMSKIKSKWGRNISKVQFFVGCFIILVILAMDFFNKPSDFGLNMMNINWSLFNILAVIFLYLLTFKNIEARTISKEKNKENIVNALLEECYTNINTLIDSLVAIKMKVTEESINEAMDIAFPNDNLIQDLIKDGLLTEKELMDYNSIKASFKRTVSFSRFMVLKLEDDIKTDIEKVYKGYKTELETLVSSALEQLKLKGLPK
ncbi:hypothetical protein QET21_000673 [Listeria monocytogenes]|uniref:Uncharacterized protein n=1 Tax=Listeria monocytogenes TaxID=1639 RepID=A0A826CHT9_LISMN|nr:hypothetical protein [Listeria monocytogenes]EAC2360257.1 hypothetical protein [Listeria monocytogenes]EAC2492334.1 hypothetical protein [Listeria monocytogenes]EAC2625051.1 hypothetical protein [Listeria monocytogenes]EAC4022579.1 hypothetical protein [Listeria monocytogenes]EAC5275456.1 hypothetical protein [Listeria monocytogenes]